MGFTAKGPTVDGETAAASAPRAMMTSREVLAAWWPLAASWLLMAFEGPAAAAVMARLHDPVISLAAWGGVVLPIAFLIEAPIIMLLSASTSLSRDYASYRLMYRFMMLAGVALTAVHVLVCFTPMYDEVVGYMLGVPEDVRGPGRLALQVMTPWTWAIAYRRFQQGVLIRFGRSRWVGLGTAVRLATNVVALATCWVLDLRPGVLAGAIAVVAGVLAEAAFAGACVRPMIPVLRACEPVSPPLTVKRFMDFYVPLAMTPLIWLASTPLASAAMSRMPLALESLAVWPVLNGLLFALRSLGVAMNEVTVSLLDRPGAAPILRRFAFGLAAVTTMMVVVVAATPLSELWFRDAAALDAPLAAIGETALWLSLPLGMLGVFVPWLQGIVVHHGRTRGITESVVAYLVATVLILGAGIAMGDFTGLHVAAVANVVGYLALVIWLRARAADALRSGPSVNSSS